MKCDKCEVDYPDTILSQMYINGSYTKPICGICALEITNESLINKRTRFKGGDGRNI